MGQHTILTLAFISLPFIWKSRITYILSGISYFKYNIGYALLLFFAVSKKYRILILSLLPCVVGWIIYCFITDTPFFENLFQPIKLAVANSELGNTLNNPFLFSFIRDISFFSNYDYQIILVLTILFNVYILLKISLITDELLKLSLICLLVLISTPHWGHDYILMTPLLIYSIKYYNFNLFLMRTNVIVCIYFLYLYSGLKIYFNNYLLYLNINISSLTKIYPYLDILILLTVLFLNIYNNKKNIST